MPFDAKRLLDGFMKSGTMGGLAAGGAAGLLLSNKKLRKTAVQVGGLALVGGVAYMAYQSWQRQKQGQGPGPVGDLKAMWDQFQGAPASSGYLPAQPAAEQDLSAALVRAMIAACKADGHIDADETKKIMAHLEKMELSAEDKAFVFDELSKPLDIAAVAAPATTPEIGAEIYAASLLAADPDHPLEKKYLADLAQRLRLEPGLVLQIEGALKQAA